MRHRRLWLHCGTVQRQPVTGGVRLLGGPRPGLEEQQQAVAGQRASCNPSAHVKDIQKTIDRITEDDLDIAVDYMLELACAQAGVSQVYR